MVVAVSVPRTQCIDDFTRKFFTLTVASPSRGYFATSLYVRIAQLLPRLRIAGIESNVGNGPVSDDDLYHEG